MVKIILNYDRIFKRLTLMYVHNLLVLLTSLPTPKLISKHYEKKIIYLIKNKFDSTYSLLFYTEFEITGQIASF